MSLRYGGVFDFTVALANAGDRKPWTEPHNEHKIGESADLRTNQVAIQGCAKGLPHTNDEVRAWFKAELYSIFGHNNHCLDSPNTTPHYHLRFRQLTRCTIN